MWLVDPALAQYIAGGLCGSLAKTILDADGHLVFPRFIRKRGKVEGINLGFVGNIFLGVLTALIVDHSFVVAVFSSMAGSYTLEKGSRRFRDALNAFFGGRR